MVVDDLHTPFERTRRLRTAARQFVERHLGANDLMAVVHTAGPADANQELTGSKRLLLAAIDRTEGRQRYSVDDIRSGDVFRGQGTRSGRAPLNPAEAERELSALRSLSVLRDTAQRFVGLRGRRKAILFVSEGIDYEVASWDGHQSGSFVDDSMRSVVAAAGRANVSVYGIDPRGLVGLLVDDTPFRPLQLSQESLHWLSSETGGFAVVSANKFAEPFDRIVRDNSSYYVLAYYPPTSKPGTSHRIEVRVRRPNVAVRTRQGYVTSKPTPVAASGAGTAGIPPGPKGLATPELTDALRTPLPLPDLTMRVFAAPFKGAASQASVLVGIEVRGRDGGAATGDTLTVAYTVVDASGKVRGGATEAVPIGAAAGAVGPRAGEDVRLLGRIDLPAGRYQIHAAGQDARAGNVGSVIYDLEVPDFAKAPFSMSGLVVTSATASAMPTLHPDDSLKAVLPASPVGSRTFPQNDDLSLFVEVYDNEGAQPHKVDIGATVTSDEGRVVARMDEVRESSDLQGRRGGYGYAATIALRSLPPGRYVLTVSARSRLGNPDAVARQAPFVVVAPGELPAP
jgi:VWFA-related protein